MRETWHVISQSSRHLPEKNQEIYCCIADESSVSEVRKMTVDLKAFDDLLKVYPQWQIFWQPVRTSVPPSPPDVEFHVKEAHYG